MVDERDPPPILDSLILNSETVVVFDPDNSDAWIESGYYFDLTPDDDASTQ